jgi:UTP--glucose-1-phosphate uridylyltransferase
MSHDPLPAILRKLESDHAPAALISTFRENVRRVSAGETGLIAERDIEPVRDLPTLDSLSSFAQAGSAALHQTVVIKLNGGLGTGMGLDRAKSLLPVKDGLTFLDIIAHQILHLRATQQAPLPLLLMNSFATEADTLAALAHHPHLSQGQPSLPPSFLQHRVPKLRADTLEPVTWPKEPALEWCPPGHGDLYTALLATGLLDRLLAAGLRYAFISNADNLGATLDPALLGYLAQRGLPFMMEVTARTEADRKGGHLARHPNGGLLLRESAQCPPTETASFQDIQRHRYFNTNNLWLDLQALHDHIQSTGQPPALPVMVNRKTVDPRDATSTAVLQLETAMGAALSVFHGAEAVCVPRTRFAPVKTTDDLLGLWSDAYHLDAQFRMTLQASRASVPPVIKLDPRYFKMWPDFEQRFLYGAPSLLKCLSLTVEGDVIFGPQVHLAGEVTVRNSTAHPVTLEHRSAGESGRETIDFSSQS